MISSLAKWHVAPTEFAPVSQPDFRREYNGNVKEVQQEPMTPTEDVRYPWYPAMMSDSRIATDYRNRCSANIPVGSQNKTREWMMRNAEEIISVSRHRMAERSGYADIYAVPRMPESAHIKCDPNQCTRIIVGDPSAWSLGDGRPVKVPELFGTYLIEPSIQQQMGQKNTKTTTHYEGGRNTPSRLRIA